MDCLFCKIIDGDIPSYTVYEDDIVKAFLDINPSTNGDSLIVPKKHCVDIIDMDEDTWNHILKIEKLMYKMFVDKLGCEGLTIVQNNGYGQEIKHFHVHLTPRYSNDKLRNSFNSDILVEFEDIMTQIKD